MVEVVQKILIFLLVLGFVIVFHELGHFVLAKLAGVKVEVFSFGFGKRLFGWKRGDTDYRVSVFPLGGYVRMAGEASADPEEPAREASPRDFEAKGLVAKLAIMFAGPAFNFVLAIGLLAVAFVLGVQEAAFSVEPPKVGVVEPDSPAARAGVLPGDLILAVDGDDVPTWEIFFEKIVLKPGSDSRLAIERAGTALELPIRIESRSKHAVGWIGVMPCVQVLVHAVSSAGAAEEGGVLPGDEIVSMNGVPPCSADGLREAVQSAAGAPIDMLVRREGHELHLSVKPTRPSSDARWLIGVTSVEPTIVRQHAPREALRASVAKNWRDAGSIVDTLGRLVTFRLSLRAMSGPMELADIASETAKSGPSELLKLIALISLNLGVFNLAPIPILDGGRIAILLVEAVKGRDLERRTKEWILLAGLAIIMVVTVLVLWFDVLKKWPIFGGGG